MGRGAIRWVQMERRPMTLPSRVTALVFVSGTAALSWEVLWQIRATLAIGVSAMGAAVTLAATMGGMTLGALMMGRALQRRVIARPLRVYAALEILVRANTASLISVSGMPLSVALSTVHLPVPFWPAVSRMTPRRRRPLPSSGCRPPRCSRAIPC